MNGTVQSKRNIWLAIAFLVGVASFPAIALCVGVASDVMWTFKAETISVGMTEQEVTARLGPPSSPTFTFQGENGLQADRILEWRRAGLDVHVCILGDRAIRVTRGRPNSF
jgi:hypothetical protein